MSTRIFGSGIKRREDPRLITGEAKYTDDMKLPGLLHMAVVRSPYAHANIVSIDTSAAAAMEGVVAVFTGEDITLAGIPTAWLIPDSELKTPEHPALAKGKVRYVGDGVAMVLADDRYRAQDAADAVVVEYEELPAVIDPEKATQAGAPQLFDDVENNIAFRWVMGDKEASDAVFENADVVVSDTILQQRLLPTAMEPRAAMAQYNPATEELTLWCTSQNPHIHRFIISAVTGLSENRVRVIAPEVGGGFGSKIPCYPDEALVSWAAIKMNRPIKWTETRSENYLITIHGRDHVQHAQMAADQNGKILGVRATVYAGMGGYLSTAAPGIPTILHGLLYVGPYTIPNVYCESIGVMTTATPTDAYRGAGRPEATFLLERLVDMVARELDVDPVELRRQNLIPKFEDGYEVATSLIYDSGFSVRGSPDQFQTIQDVALMAHLAWNLPEGMDPGFEESQFYDPPNFVYPFGTHIAIVEVDPDTGDIDLQRYIAVDDCGPQINPEIVQGQIHGGVVQGVAQALCEGVIYDENGQLLTGSMMDYTLPRADMFPNFELDETVTPSPHHPIGVKGVGETGTIASTPTVYNAVLDALAPLGVDKIDMPLTSFKVWDAIQQSNANGGGA